MKGERGLLRTGEFLVARAARRLPARVRDERHREWAAELPAILRDPSLGRPGGAPPGCWAMPSTPSAPPP